MNISISRTGWCWGIKWDHVAISGNEMEKEVELCFGSIRVKMFVKLPLTQDH